MLKTLLSILKSIFWILERLRDAGPDALADSWDSSRFFGSFVSVSTVWDAQVELKMVQLGHIENQLEMKAEELHQLQEDQKRNEGSARSLNISASQKDDRIEELEEALRESVRITADREMVLHNETQLRMQISDKVLQSFRILINATPFTITTEFIQIQSPFPFSIRLSRAK